MSEAVAGLNGFYYKAGHDGLYECKLPMFHRADGVVILNNRSLFMVDLDLPNEGHKAIEAITISDKDQVFERLERIDYLWGVYQLPAGPARWRLYTTPGGVHAFRLDAPVAPDSRAFQLAANTDPRYARLMLNTRLWPVRVSAKPGRIETAAADLWLERYGSIGRRIHPECEAQMRVHDTCILRYSAAHVLRA